MLNVVQASGIVFTMARHAQQRFASVALVLSSDRLSVARAWASCGLCLGSCLRARQATPLALSFAGRGVGSQQARWRACPDGRAELTFPELERLLEQR